MTTATLPLSRSQLSGDLTAAGIRHGENLIVHSSLKKIGVTENGPATVVDALLDALGPEGNLMVPTFTYCYPSWKAEPFHLQDTASRVGAITEYLRHRPDAVRSFHPTHSTAVIGPDAAAIIANHLQATPIGRLSPFGRMYDRNARILLLGTYQDTNSSIHLCEVMLGLPYVSISFTPEFDYDLAWFLNSKEHLEYHQIFQVPGCSRGFRKIEPDLQAAGILQPVRVGNADCQLFEMHHLLECLCPVLEKDPIRLLCDIETCAICPRRRQFIQGI
jgi:aminoglycoside 3-N-acetyltransferase